MLAPNFKHYCEPAIYVVMCCKYFMEEYNDVFLLEEEIILCVKINKYKNRKPLHMWNLKISLAVSKNYAFCLCIKVKQTNPILYDLSQLKDT